MLKQEEYKNAVELFEKWMSKSFDEPEWDEGYSRADIREAFIRAYEIGKEK